MRLKVLPDGLTADEINKEWSPPADISVGFSINVRGYITPAF
jgi:hypothetical protein